MNVLNMIKNILKFLTARDKESFPWGRHSFPRKPNMFFENAYSHQTNICRFSKNVYPMGTFFISCWDLMLTHLQYSIPQHYEYMEYDQEYHKTVNSFNIKSQQETKNVPHGFLVLFLVFTLESPRSGSSTIFGGLFLCLVNFI